MNAKILYIVGGGHSGSTLLSLIFGTAKDVFSLGEVFYYNAYNEDVYDSKILKSKSTLCTCGEKFSECDFWSAVNQQLDRAVAIPRKSSLSETLKITWNMITSPISALKLKIDLGDDKYLFETIDKHLNNEGRSFKYFLDSSKDPRRLVRLVELFGKENIHVIFLIRDIRGYVNSYNNKNKPRVTEGGQKVDNFLITAFNWIIFNSLTKLYIKRNKLKAIHISYDLFTQNPELYINYINDELSISIPSDYIGRVNSKTFHNLHGNLMKFDKLKEVRTDIKWMTELSLLKRSIISIISFPFNFYYTKRDDVS